MNPYTVLIRDHRRIVDLFDRLDETPSMARATRERLFTHLRRELLAHGDAETETFYLAIQHDSESEQGVFRAIDDHAVIRGMVEDIAAIPADDIRWRDALALLRELVEEHIAEEEEELFAYARETLSPAASNALGDRILARKSSLILDLATRREDILVGHRPASRARVG
jgi:hypothetical protein